MMLPHEPLAYFLTWTCKGERLHGDPRGSVDRDHNVFGTPILGPDPGRRQGELRRMDGPAQGLDDDTRAIVAATLQEVADCRGWTILAAAVRTNHVHVVVAAAGSTPERAMTDFKAWSTRRLRQRGFCGANDALWARHGSTRYLWSGREIAVAVDYAREGQDVPR